DGDEAAPPAAPPALRAVYQPDEVCRRHEERGLADLSACGPGPERGLSGGRVMDWVGGHWRPQGSRRPWGLLFAICPGRLTPESFSSKGPRAVSEADGASAEERRRDPGSPGGAGRSGLHTSLHFCAVFKYTLGVMRVALVGLPL